VSQVPGLISRDAISSENIHLFNDGSRL